MSDLHLVPTPHVVVGVDGSEHSKHALRWAAKIAEPFGATLRVVSAWEYPVGFGWSLLPDGWNPAEDIEKSLTETIDEVFGTSRPIGLETAVRQGPAASVITQYSRGALMVVVGSRGHGGFTGLLLGSVSSAVAAHAHCPVLVVHGDEIPPAVAS